VNILLHFNVKQVRVYNMRVHGVTKKNFERYELHEIAKRTQGVDVLLVVIEY